MWNVIIALICALAITACDYEIKEKKDETEVTVSAPSEEVEEAIEEGLEEQVIINPVSGEEVTVLVPITDNTNNNEEEENTNSNTNDNIAEEPEPEPTVFYVSPEEGNYSMPQTIPWNDGYLVLHQGAGPQILATTLDEEGTTLNNNVLMDNSGFEEGITKLVATDGGFAIAYQPYHQDKQINVAFFDSDLNHLNTIYPVHGTDSIHRFSFIKLDTTYALSYMKLTTGFYPYISLFSDDGNLYTTVQLNDDGVTENPHMAYGLDTIAVIWPEEGAHLQFLTEQGGKIGSVITLLEEDSGDTTRVLFNGSEFLAFYTENNRRCYIKSFTHNADLIASYTIDNLRDCITPQFKHYNDTYYLLCMGASAAYHTLDSETFQIIDTVQLTEEQSWWPSIASDLFVWMQRVGGQWKIKGHILEQ